MTKLSNYQAKRFFSGKIAKLYPTSVPDGDNHKVYIENLAAGCSRPEGKVSVLELGCGTGRYFLYLNNVKKLVGVDISKDMLAIAEEFVKSNPALQPVTTLVHSSLEEFNPDEKYDFIYSIGTLGEYCKFNKEILEKMVGSLNPGGFLFFTLVDAESFVDTEHVWMRKKIKRFLLKLLPGKLRAKIDPQSMVIADWKRLFVSRNEVEKIFDSLTTPVRKEITLAKDNIHVHHICRVWLDKKIKMLMGGFYYASEAAMEFFIPELVLI